MVHSGYEASAVDHTFSGLSGVWATIKATFAGEHHDADALQLLNEPARPVHSYNPLVQIAPTNNQMEETRA